MAVNPHQEFILETLDDAFTAANRAKLDPTWTTDHSQLIFDCPQCKQDDIKQRCHAQTGYNGGLIADCNTCGDNTAPGIIGLLEIVGRPPGKLIELHPNTNGNGTHPEPALLAWTPLDIVTLGDTPRIPPELGALIYLKRRHLITGESESGKSWLLFGIAADELKAGHGVVWVDLDYMGAQDILERLRQLGVTDTTIRERFACYQPEGALTGPNLDAVLHLIHTTNARLVCIDAFTGFCALHGLKPNDGIDIEHAYRLMQPLCEANCAVAIIDHVVKDKANQGRYASGSERKLSGADVAIGFSLIEPFGRGKTGRSRLTVHKDRPAQLQRPTAGIFTLTSDDSQRVTWRLDEDHTKGTDGTIRLTGYMEKVSRYLEAQLPSHATGSQTESDVEGKAEHIRAALKTLVAEGFAHLEVAGRAHHYTSLRKYREAEDDD